MGWSTSETTYQRLLASFKKIRADYERHEALDIGGRSFILVDAVSMELKAKKNDDSSLLEKLLDAAYGRHNRMYPPKKPGELHKFLPAFYTLLDLDCGHLINKFMEHEPPLEKLPVEKDTLRNMFPVDELDYYTKARFERRAEDIYNAQWAWCALEFNWCMSSDVHHHEQIVPIIARSQIQPTRDGIPNPDRKATLWVVEVPAECIGYDLESTLLEADDDTDGNTSETGEIPKIVKICNRPFLETQSLNFRCC